MTPASVLCTNLVGLQKFHGDFTKPNSLHFDLKDMVWYKRNDIPILYDTKPPTKNEVDLTIFNTSTLQGRFFSSPKRTRVKTSTSIPSRSSPGCKTSGSYIGNFPIHHWCYRASHPWFWMLRGSRSLWNSALPPMFFLFRSAPGRWGELKSKSFLSNKISSCRGLWWWNMSWNIEKSTVAGRIGVGIT